MSGNERLRAAEQPARLTNMTRIEDLLTDPRSDISLPELRAELNELAKLRHNSRLSFCKRLAVAYLLIVGRRFSMNAPRDGGTKKFTLWCTENIRTANNKNYSTGTLLSYLNIGFSASPEKTLAKEAQRQANSSEKNRNLGAKIKLAIERPVAPKPIPIIQLRERFDLNRDVATEVNQLMRAWEQACPEARRIFIQQVR